MFRAFVLCVSALALAGRVAALNFSLPGMTMNVTVQQLLQIPSGPYLDACTTNCSTINSTIVNCADDSCVCTNDVASALAQCEQCMFNFLVARNEKAPDPRIGSNVALSQYAGACNKTFTNAVLTIAPGWDGPTDIILNTPSTVVVVGFGAILAGSALMMFSSL
ncbi:uncharacterized protein FOMMEDRAFT_23085 [Fomitiporia mediterranea MF3/22]|uniref:uncharacterized protein n=1 Tax=Fomitiporia mediterranea (strain MF3/22) TaxID=694068 RepID=UPI0004408A01|nr:uncharacterized protein FOMMEDRAFT_23085 [Fomitiporia mediterranea MF3/22]EJC99174.1 hypothetical protein FOMMEDRAFT_23085 [Fomitiporia mediterranea MF3/22]